ncbi:MULTISPECIES: DUF6153 family protein [Streptomyces]|uniref:DUF6153 family protein n=1 Tax=Streptomyces TaxID=1883 RepID=UPI00084C62FC|nr:MULTISPECIES: DUF6153 family protein [Streptomyces]TFI21620.1 hypothetical protein E4P36_32220 [Streptomyces sp. 4R-3d]
MNARGYGRVGSALGRLLLIVVLALGVFAMHTVGHPDEPGASESGAGAMVHASGEPAPPPEPAPPHPSAADEPVMGMDGMSMDMASLCLAVLSTWALAALLLAAFARRADVFTDPLAGLRVAPRPNPPPRTPELTLLSVLRI